MKLKYYETIRGGLVIKSDNYNLDVATFSGEVVKSNDERYSIGEIRTDWTTRAFKNIDFKETPIPEPVVITSKKIDVKSFPDLKDIKELTLVVPNWMQSFFNLKREVYSFKGNAIRNVYDDVKKAYNQGIEVSWSGRTYLEPKVAITKLLNGEILYTEEGNEVKFDTNGFLMFYGNDDNPQWEYVEEFDKLSKEK